MTNALGESRSVEENTVAVHVKIKSRQPLDRLQKPTKLVHAIVIKFFSEYFGSVLFPTLPTLHVSSSIDQWMYNGPTGRRPLILIAEDRVQSHASPSWACGGGKGSSPSTTGYPQSESFHQCAVLIFNYHRRCMRLAIHDVVT